MWTIDLQTKCSDTEHLILVQIYNRYFVCK
jgi:hypothetical protein